MSGIIFSAEGNLLLDTTGLTEVGDSMMLVLLGSSFMESEQVGYVKGYYLSSLRAGNCDGGIVMLSSTYMDRFTYFIWVQKSRDGLCMLGDTIAYSGSVAECLSYRSAKILPQSNRIQQLTVKRCFNAETNKIEKDSMQREVVIRTQ